MPDVTGKPNDIWEVYEALYEEIQNYYEEEQNYEPAVGL